MARVGDAVITRQQFEAELRRRSAKGAAVATLAEREAVLDDMIRFEALCAKARAAGYDRRPDIQEQFKKILAGRYEEEEFQKQAPVPKPEPGEVELFYRNHQEQFTAPEKIRVAVIVLKMPGKIGAEQVAAAQQRAVELRERALQSRDETFGLLAQENSDDVSTRYRGGDCGWITRQTQKYRWDPALVNAMFALEKPGDITLPIRAADGFYLAKLIERKPPATAPLDQVRDRIERQLLAAKQKQAREAFDRAQRAGLAVSVNAQLLRSIPPAANLAKNNPSTPPPGPNP